jgi:hypothetical protein
MKSKTRVTRSDDSSEALNNMVEIQRRVVQGEDWLRGDDSGTRVNCRPLN